MVNDSLQAMLGYPALFCTPWVLGIGWLLRRTTSRDGTPEPSYGEALRRRLTVD